LPVESRTADPAALPIRLMSAHPNVSERSAPVAEILLRDLPLHSKFKISRALSSVLRIGAFAFLHRDITPMAKCYGELPRAALAHAVEEPACDAQYSNMFPGHDGAPRSPAPAIT